MRAPILIAAVALLAGCRNTSPAPGSPAGASAPILAGGAAPSALASASPGPPATGTAAAASASTASASTAPSAAPGALVDTRPACTAASMDLASVVRDCPCAAVRADDGKLPLCAWPDEAAVALAVRSLTLHADVPATARAGSTLTIALRLENTSAAPLPLFLMTGAAPRVWLRDAKGGDLPVPRDAACPGPQIALLTGSLEPEPHIILPPGGVLTATATVSLTRRKTANVKVDGGAELGGLGAGLALPGSDVPVRGAKATSFMACREVSAGPLAPGDYSIEPTIGLLPDALSSKVDPHVIVHVR
jgi:hypothetical protein